MIEVPLCICLSIKGLEGFAFYLSQSVPVAKITQQMWKVGASASVLIQTVHPDYFSDYRLVLHFLRR